MRGGGDKTRMGYVHHSGGFSAVCETGLEYTGTAVWLAIRLYRHWCSQWGCFWRNVWRRLMNKEEGPHSVRSALTPSFTPPVTIKTYIHWCCKTSDRAESFSHIYSFSSSEGLLLISVNEAVCPSLCGIYRGLCDVCSLNTFSLSAFVCNYGLNVTLPIPASL